MGSSIIDVIRYDRYGVVVDFVRGSGDFREREDAGFGRVGSVVDVRSRGIGDGRRFLQTGDLWKLEA